MLDRSSTDYQAGFAEGQAAFHSLVAKWLGFTLPSLHEMYLAEFPMSSLPTVPEEKSHE